MRVPTQREGTRQHGQAQGDKLHIRPPIVERLEPGVHGGECAAKFSLLGDRMDCCVGHRKAPRCAMPGSPARKPQGLTSSHIPVIIVRQLTSPSLTPIASSRRASKPAKSSSPLDPLARSVVMSVQPLFTPLRMGDLDLPNRIVMAPLTRMRAGSMDHVPTALQAEYYAQRASAGLIVAEAT